MLKIEGEEATVPTAIHMVWVILNNPLAKEIGTVEDDSELINCGPRLHRDIESFRNEHVVDFEKLLVVQEHCCVTIEAFEGYDNLLAWPDTGHNDSGLVHP